MDGFREYYEFWFEQPINHSDVSKGMFRQKVFLGHKKTDAPVIAELQGYQIGSGAEGELSALFEANQLTIEHRFFDQSVPEGGIPWEYLTIKQAAADHHNIIQTIRKQFIRLPRGFPQESAKEDRPLFFIAIFIRMMLKSVFRMLHL